MPEPSGSQDARTVGARVQGEPNRWRRIERLVGAVGRNAERVGVAAREGEERAASQGQPTEVLR